MKLFLNIVIILAIIVFAGYLLVKTFQRDKQGKCAACDFECQLKKHANKMNVK